ncbi:MAG: two-component regulator propeller domain-containing protein [Bacteroidia bacterium]
MRKYFLHNPAYLFLLGLIFFVSCNAQVKTNLPKEDTKPSLNVSSELQYVLKPQNYYKEATIGCTMQDRAGNIWFGSNGEGIYRFNGSNFTHFTEKEGLCNNVVYCILEDKSGYVWVGTQTGLCRYDPASRTFKPFVSHLNYEDKPAKNSVWSAMQDSKGTVWFGTTDGVYCYNGLYLRPFLNDKELVNKDSLKLRVIYSMLEDKKGVLWFTSGDNEGICRFDGKTLTSITPPKFGMIDLVVMDRNDDLWFSTRQRGICTYSYHNGKGFQENVFKNREALDNSNNTAITVNNTGHLWFGKYGENGMGYTFDGELLSPIMTPPALNNQAAWFLMQDKNSNYWYGSPQMGLHIYDGYNLTTFTEK